MGLLNALFGSRKPPSRPYVDEGLKLTKNLIALLGLSDWTSGTPAYTDREVKAIDTELRSFQRMADTEAQRRGQGQARFAPEMAGAMERLFGSEALCRLAGPGMGGWELDDACPEDWKARVSTYLKAWA